MGTELDIYFLFTIDIASRNCKCNVNLFIWDDFENGEASNLIQAMSKNI
jgi:hypothetical protein